MAPPSLEAIGSDERITAFAPLARERLRFPSILAASRDDPYAPFGHARKMARIWGSRLVDAGWVGHINADSSIGDWPFGQHLVNRLVWSLAAEARRHPGSGSRIADRSHHAIALAID